MGKINGIDLSTEELTAIMVLEKHGWSMVTQVHCEDYREEVQVRGHLPGEFRAPIALVNLELVDG